MRNKLIERIFKDTAYVRVGGSAQEKECAQYLIDVCKEVGAQAYIEEFPVAMADISEAVLEIDGKSITCKGYKNCGSHDVSAELYYLRATDPRSLALCKGKIVLIDGYLGYWKYKDITENGAIGFITYDGSVNYADRDIDQRELRTYISEGVKIPGVSINVKDAVALVKAGAKNARIRIEQNEYEGTSQNVIVDLKGESDRTIAFTAHYDSTSLSTGAYDNMSGCVGLIGMIEYFSKRYHRHNLKFIFCGSEERGLLGSKAYCEAHADELDGIDLVINLDMIGCTMGKFIACCTTEKNLVSYIECFGAERGFQVAPYQDVYSSDSTPFADKGVPAVSFARSSPPSAATIHNSYDTLKIIRTKQMVDDIDFITAFTERMANAVYCPVLREIPENIKTKLDEYLLRKRKK